MSGRRKLNLVVPKAAHSAALSLRTKEHSAKALSVLATENIFEGYDTTYPDAQSLIVKALFLFGSQRRYASAGLENCVRNERANHLEPASVRKLLPLRIDLKWIEQLYSKTDFHILCRRLPAVHYVYNALRTCVEILDRPLRLIKVSLQLHLGMALCERHKLAVLIDRLGTDLHRLVSLHDGGDQNERSNRRDHHLQQRQARQMSGRRSHLLLSQKVASSALINKLFGHRRPTSFSGFKTLKTFCDLSLSRTLGRSDRGLAHGCRRTEGKRHDEGCGEKSKFQGSLPSFATRHSTTFAEVAA